MTDNKFLPPKFRYDDIQYSVDGALFKRAIELYKHEKVDRVVEHKRGYDAVVEGSELYRVSVSRANVTVAYCDCYMGQNDELCKHVIALALVVLFKSGAVDKDGLLANKTEVKNSTDLAEEIKKGMKYIKYYNGPSNTWFAYQTKLDIGAGILMNAVENAPKSVESAKVLWKMVMKLSDKLSGGVDDSNGTVWPVCDVAVDKLLSWKDDKEIRKCLDKFAKDKTGFDFEEPLQNM